MENVRISPNRSLGKSAINIKIASQKDADKEPTVQEPYSAESRSYVRSYPVVTNRNL